MANNTPEITISSEELEVVQYDSPEFLAHTSYDAVEQSLEFVTAEDIDNIQIFDKEGKLQFQLPVGSNKVRINKNLLGQGVSKLGFNIKGKSETHYTTVRIK